MWTKRGQNGFRDPTDLVGSPSLKIISNLRQACSELQMESAQNRIKMLF